MDGARVEGRAGARSAAFMCRIVMRIVMPRGHSSAQANYQLGMPSMHPEGKAEGRNAPN